MKLRVVLLIALFGAAGCSSVGFKHYTTWSPELLQRVVLIPLFDAPFTSLHFDPRHRAYGPYNHSRQGLVTPGGIVYEWQIKDGWLVLRDPKSGYRAEYRLRHAGGYFITVERRDGKVLRFHYDERG